MKQFSVIVNEMVATRSEPDMGRLVAYVRQNCVSDEDLAYLSGSLASSGAVRSPSKLTADLASTGGPSSLTTLVSPLYLRALGYRVPKLGVPGRPAGGIDVMAQVPGFKFRQDFRGVDRVLKRSGYAHVLADETFTPLDIKFFQYRQRVGAQAVPIFAISSILAKKLAMGVKRAGLEVRVAAHGNLGDTWRIARENAMRFCRVSKLLGIDGVAILTDGRLPYQPYIGRGEALVALDLLFADAACSQLRSHFNLCFALAASTLRMRVSRRPNANQLQAVFESHLVAQGSDLTSFNRAVDKVKSQPRVPLLSTCEGFVRINLQTIRHILVRAQSAVSSVRTQFPDPCGITLYATSDSYVRKGDCLAEVRLASPKCKGIAIDLKKAFSIAQNLPNQLAPYEEVHCG